MAAKYDFNTSPDVQGKEEQPTLYSEEERFTLLTDYLKKHAVITYKEYCELTRLLKTKAGKELCR